MLAVAEGLATLATLRGGPRFVAAFDEVAIEAGVSRATAKRSMDALIAMKLVRRDLTGGGRFAPLWVLRGRGLPESAPTISLACDTARWAGLGKTTVHVARLLTADPQRPAKISAVMGIGVEAVRKHLRKLRDAGLVALGDDGWSLVGDVEAVAGQLGTAGMRVAHATAIEAQREMRRLELDSWVGDRNGPTT